MKQGNEQDRGKENQDPQIKKIKIGVSACLMGQNVRYNGGHTRDPYLIQTLGRFMDYVPVCPETECGMPVPREAMRLTGDPENPSLTTIKTKKDMTAQMKAWAEKRLDGLEKEDLCGFIFKSKSPSSGLFRVRVYNDKGMPSMNGTGIWAGMFVKRFPLLPAEEEGRLHDPVLRENFIERVFVFKRWRELIQEGKTPGGLVDFHTRHKMLFLAHSPQVYREMGKLVAAPRKDDMDAWFDDYARLLTRAMLLKSTVAKNVNVLQHMMGYFKKELSADEKQELLEVLENYKKRRTPLIAPITLVKHYARKYREPYLGAQVYLNPHPVELGLRNHV
ncbi:conserved hypothetical protein [Candidatus Desulfarcum epimagneticum]|uniref:DUF1722 domain-containing protein n=1 Tax=uncultured Desulfobacteraceae bacterium TaxID=218296 RepID=A0A484HHX3_9BACT|nr:conserved hypothetical protein [uncultured Desulfobacteraceae bacterium]